MLKASGGTTSSASANISASSQHVDPNNANASSSVVHVDNGKAQHAKADAENHIAGYIFMCNTGTKPDCFMYRVFGLPASRMKVVQNIKPNTMLFLFDFDVKLLYGLYVADSSGKLGLEPHAFGGKFPAQVKFSIARDCLPLPEVVFKDVIKENYYSGSKFKQELNDEQVNKLVSLFRPITVPSPQKTSPTFTHALRSFYQKYVEPSQQVTRYAHMHGDRSEPEVPQVAPASSYYGQNPIPQSTMSPAAPVVAPSSLSASRLVAMAAQALNAEGQTSNLIPSTSNEPLLNHAPMSYNGSNSRGVGYSYSEQVNPSSHQYLPVNNSARHAHEMPPYSVSSYYQTQGNATLPQTLASRSSSDQYLPVNNSAMHAHEMPPYSVSSYYQTQGNATLPQTLASGSTSERVGNTYLKSDSRNHPASISYGYYQYQGDPSLPHIQPSIGADNSNLYYNGTNSATLVHDYGNQGYYSGNPAAVGTSVQQSNNAPGVYQPYWYNAPGYVNQDHHNTTYSSAHPGPSAHIATGYVNQDYHNTTYSYAHPGPSANITTGYAPVGGSGAYLT